MTLLLIKPFLIEELSFLYTTLRLFSGSLLSLLRSQWIEQPDLPVDAVDAWHTGMLHNILIL